MLGQMLTWMMSLSKLEGKSLAHEIQDHVAGGMETLTGQYCVICN